MIIRVPEGVTGVKVMTDTDIKDVCSYFHLSSTLPVYISGSRAKTLCSVDDDNELMIQAEKPNDSSPANVSAEMTLRMPDDHGIKLHAPNTPGIKLQAPDTPVIMDSESDDILPKVTSTPDMLPPPDNHDNGRGIFPSTLPRAGATYSEIDDDTIIAISVPSSVIVLICMCIYLYCRRRRRASLVNESGLELVSPLPQPQPQTPPVMGRVIAPQNTPDLMTPSQTPP